MPFFGVPIRNGLPIGLGSVAGFGVQQFDPSQLFAAGEQGTWYDPSDFSTLFSDTSGTVPVTGIEDVVGYMLDKSGNGNHAIAPIGVGNARPTLRARYNLLTYSEEFDQGVWTKYSVLVDANATTDPFGGNNADRLKSNSTTNSLLLQQAALNLISGATYRRSVYAKADAISTLTMQISGTTEGTIFVQADLVNGTATNGGVVENAENGWWRISRTFTMSGTTNDFYFRLPTGTAVGSGVFIFGAQLLTAADAFATGNAYQRIAAATVYDTSNSVFRPYLAFGGTQAMSTGSIVPGTNKAQAFAGVTKLSDAAAGIIFETSSAVGSNAGSLLMSNFDFGGNQGPRYNLWTRGTIANALIWADGYAAPITNVVTGTGDISGDSAILRVNATQVASSATDQGAGNYLTYPLNIGARNNGASAFLVGRIYSLITRFGPNLSAAEISATESWVNQRTGAY